MLETPPFPSYTSGHATVSGAASEVIAAALPQHTRMLRDDAAEAARSRVYGGIHWRIDGSEGLAVGRQIGREVADAYSVA
jgi:membrane-associated phospholipid phosphatase